jgi:lipid-binding SYLF domain-containing protein
MKAKFLTLALAALALFVAPLGAATKESDTLQAAAEVLNALTAIPLKGIPLTLLRDAKGIAIIPGVLKAGLVVGGRFGKGVVLVRHPDGTWGDPLFVRMTGGSFGAQAGVQSTDVVLVFQADPGLHRILKGKGKLTLGADAAVAAGPLGRQAEAATDSRLKAEIYSYSRSRGLFAGVALEGACIMLDAEANQAFYRTVDVGSGKLLAVADVQSAVLVTKLKSQLAGLCRAPPTPPVLLPPQVPPLPPIPPPPSNPGPPR